MPSQNGLRPDWPQRHSAYRSLWPISAPTSHAIGSPSSVSIWALATTVTSPTTAYGPFGRTVMRGSVAAIEAPSGRRDRTA